jgi:hypothetical protein
MALHMDSGGEFTTTEFNKYCAELGVQHELTALVLSPAKWHHGAP